MCRNASAMDLVQNKTNWLPIALDNRAHRHSSFGKHSPWCHVYSRFYRLPPVLERPVVTTGSVWLSRAKTGHRCVSTVPGNACQQTLVRGPRSLCQCSSIDQLSYARLDYKRLRVRMAQIYPGVAGSGGDPLSLYAHAGKCVAGPCSSVD